MYCRNWCHSSNNGVTFNQAFLCWRMKRLFRRLLPFAVVCLPTVHSSAMAIDDWRQIGRYQNNGVYSTELHSRLVRGSSSLSEGRRISFQIKLVGYSVGAMEFDYSCASDRVLFKRVIPIPGSGLHRFDDNSKEQFASHAAKAANYYCDNFSALPVISSAASGNLLYENPNIFAEEALNTCLGARAMKDLIDGYPARFCIQTYREKGLIND